MKLTDAEKTYKDIEKMSLTDKQKQILEIQKKGFIYDNKEIKEIIKDKWVFVENKTETDIVSIDCIIYNWIDAEELRLEQEQAESGKTVIDKYFKKYGTLSLKEKPKDDCLHSQIVYFGGKACPGGTWNTELFMYRLRVYKPYDDKYSSSLNKYTMITADRYVEDLMDAKMKGDQPDLRHCHDWYTNPHKKSENHYSYENWLKDIEDAKDIFIKEVKKLIKGHETFQYSTKTGLYCIPEKTVFWFEGEADHNGDDTKFYASTIYGNNNYKGSDFRSNTKKVPKKFDKVVSCEEIIEIAAQHCEDKFKKHNFRKEFKY